MSAYYKTCKQCGGPNYSMHVFCSPECKEASKAATAERKRHAAKVRKEYLIIYRQDKRRKDHGIKCFNCPVLALCSVEIKRPDFWPPCCPASRFYDPQLHAKIEVLEAAA